jgi:hypothetical protein
MDEIAWEAVMSDGILALSQSSRQGDEIEISSGGSRSQRGDNLIEILQYFGAQLKTAAWKIGTYI